MKTVKEVADELGVSQVTVYNHLKKLKKEIKDNIVKVKGATHITQEGINQLEISMGLSDIPKVKENISVEEIITDISDLVTQNMKSDYEGLKEDIKEVQEQNKILIELIKDKQKEEEKKGFINHIISYFKK